MEPRYQVESYQDTKALTGNHICELNAVFVRGSGEGHDVHPAVLKAIFLIAQPVGQGTRAWEEKKTRLTDNR